MQPNEGLELDGRYQLRREVDAGNFGAVYEAVDRKFDSRVAIKVLFESSINSSTFRGEALLARQFRHPNVVEVYEFGQDEEHGLAYIVMEFLEGLRVDQLIAEPEFQPGLFHLFVDQIGSALDTAHKRQLVHRDLKPQNVMLVDRGQPTQRFLLLDLGVATKTDSKATLRNKELDGALSPQYASPEQIESRDVDYRSDIYSFGTVLYEWLTAKPPFQSEQLLGLANAICNLDPPHPSEVTDREIDPAIEAVVLECLHKNPARRPESIGEVRRRILAAMGTIVPRPDASAETSVGESRKTARPHAETLSPPGETAESPLIARPGSGRPDRDLPEWKKVSPRRTFTIGKALVVVACAAIGIAWFFGGNETLRLEVPASVEVVSGTTTQTSVRVAGSHSGKAKVSVEVLDVPDWLQVEALTDTVASEPAGLTLTAALRPQAESATIRIKATVGDASADATMEVQLTPPEIWLPEGFEPASGELVSSGTHNRVVHTQIQRPIGSEMVRFLLVSQPEKLAPFYVMQDKVWNALLLKCAEENPTRFPTVPDREEWRQGAMANGEAMGIAHRPQFPVMNLNAFEAHAVAAWIGGPTSHLPTVAQWDVAAGFEAYRRGKLSSTPWSEGPFRKSDAGVSQEVAVGLRPFGPRAVGRSADDIGPFGCRDMAGNGLELTSSLLSNALVPNCDEDAFVLTRGRSYQSEGPLLWSELETAAQGGLPQGLSASDRDPTCGFRVVIEITPRSDSDRK